MSERVERLRASLEEPLLVTNRVNVFYLTGFQSSNAVLLVERGRTRLFTDFRYAEAARRVAQVEFVETPRAILPELAERLSGRIAFEADSLTYAGYETLRAGGLELVPRSGVVEALRAVKGDDELAAIREAAAITSRAFERLSSEPFVGRSERELAWRMEVLLREEGAEEVAFDVVVGAGANGATPHARPGDTAVERGQTVVVDAAARIRGYQSDCTRTFATGDIPVRLRSAYDVCLDAQAAGLASARAGMTGRGLDAVARERIDATDFAGAFGHGLGHGLGLELHEAPVARPESTDVLEPRNVLTIEPGIYVPGLGGIRIEDLVVIRSAGGPEVLTTFTKELVTVD
ncbi:MAG: Xaa-Pro peptidase family protein [Actinomycetota bacterium]|nr:Xaa-Pro peptidase family protein [Actinomycetota bacterium]